MKRPSTSGSRQSTKRPSLRSLAHQHVEWLTRMVPVVPKIQRSISKTVKLDRPQIAENNKIAGRPKFVVRLLQADTFAAARYLSHQYPGERIAVLNMACADRPGGGFLGGGRAQEEDLCHCSSLFLTLKPELYPMTGTELIYSPNVAITGVKDSEYRHGVRTLDQSEWVYIDVISCAAPRRSRVISIQRTDNDGKVVSEDTYESQFDRDLMKAKLNHIMSAAVSRGVNRLVLGAFGCGSYKNPIREVARMMKEILFNKSDNDGPEHDWAQYGLVEVIIAIYDTDTRANRPVWHGFLKEFCQGGGLHTTGGVREPHDDLQHTVFPQRYAEADM